MWRYNCGIHSCFHCCNICVLVSCAFCFSYYLLAYDDNSVSHSELHSSLNGKQKTIDRRKTKDSIRLLNYIKVAWSLVINSETYFNQFCVTLHSLLLFFLGKYVLQYRDSYYILITQSFRKFKILSLN